jgi:hypothetical protein
MGAIDKGFALSAILVIVCLGTYLGLTGARQVSGHVTELACPSPGMPSDCNPGTPAGATTVRFQLLDTKRFFDAVTDQSGDYAITLPQGRYATHMVVHVPERDGTASTRVEDWDRGPSVVSVGPLGSRADFAFYVVSQ